MEKYNKYFFEEVDHRRWNKLWDSFEFSNLMQSWEYGNSKQNIFCKVKRYLIKSFTDKPIGLVQILYYKIFFFTLIVRVNRGPLIKDSYSSAYFFIFKALENYLKKKNCAIFIISPELDFNESNLSFFKNNGYKPRFKKVCASSKISLKENENLIFMNLKSKWRNLLRKSKKSNLVVEIKESNNIDIKNLLDSYEEFQKLKNFNGISRNLLAKLVKEDGFNWRFRLYICHQKIGDKKTFAGMLVSILHGKTTTYLIGFTSQIGRAFNANYLMLWRSIIEAKTSECIWYDLGGLSKNTPKGIAHFKNGLNGNLYKNLPEFFKFIFW